MYFQAEGLHNELHALTAEVQQKDTEHAQLVASLKEQIQQLRDHQAAEGDTKIQQLTQDLQVIQEQVEFAIAHDMAKCFSSS